MCNRCHVKNHAKHAAGVKRGKMHALRAHDSKFAGSAEKTRAARDWPFMHHTHQNFNPLMLSTLVTWSNNISSKHLRFSCTSTGFDTMSANEQDRVRNLFSDANHQMIEARRAQIARIARARVARRFKIMQEAGRLMAESRNLQQLAELEGIPLNLPFQQTAMRRQQIPYWAKSATEIGSTKNLARDIVGLISDIEKAEKREKERKREKVVN